MRADVFEDIQEYLTDIRDLLEDYTVSEVMLNPLGDGHSSVFIENMGQKYPVPGRTVQSLQVAAVARRVAAAVGHDLEANPICEGRLADGSRVTIVMPPASPIGLVVAIRKFSKHVFSLPDLVDNGSVNDFVASLFGMIVERRQNLLISGGTDSGKTTLLNALARLIPDEHRLLLIEKPREIRLDHSNQVRLEASDTTSPRDLTRAAMRLSPDRIIFGEVRGDEALDLLQALNSGHAGSLCTIHANSALLALSKLTNYALRGASSSARNDSVVHHVPIRREIADCIHYVAQVQKQPNGRRMVTEVIRLDRYNVETDNFEVESLYSARIPDQEEFSANELHSQAR